MCRWIAQQCYIYLEHYLRTESRKYQGKGAKVNHTYVDQMLDDFESLIRDPHQLPPAHYYWAWRVRDGNANVDS